MRMLWLDFFRGVAALTVVAFHLHAPLGIANPAFGFLAVDLFFVLSGIVLGQRYTSAITGGMPFLQFAWHRLRRLYPMVLIATLLVVVMNFAGLPDGRITVASSSPLGVLSCLRSASPRGWETEAATPRCPTCASSWF